MGKHELFLLKTGPRQGQSPLFNLGLKILTKLLEWGGKEEGDNQREERKQAPQFPETVKAWETQGAAQMTPGLSPQQLTALPSAAFREPP